MPYSTIDDVRELLPEAEIVRLTDDEGLGVAGVSRVSEAIAQADSEIDGYCGGRYSVPVQPVPDLLKKLSVDMAIYNLYSRAVLVMPGARAERYRNAVRQLEGISRGLVFPGAAAQPADDTGHGAGTNREAEDNVFRRSTMEGF